MEVWQFAAVLLAALALRRWCFELIRVQGNSMNATLRSGDILWVTRFDYRNRLPQRQDVVICYYPGRYLQRCRWIRQCFVKRVVVCPGRPCPSATVWSILMAGPFRNPTWTHGETAACIRWSR